MAIATLTIDMVAKLANIERDMGRASQIAQTNAAKMEKAFKGVGAALSGLAVGAFMQKVVAATVEQERVTKQLEATLKSTGGAAGLTRDELLSMASGLQEVTTFGDEATIAAQSLLLTFTNIGREAFPQALEAVLNVSTAMGTDLKSAALQVGKALNDPVKGMASLAESGIQFSQSQKDTIKQLSETGRTAQAQAVILKELETQFGGSARAARDTLGGALSSLQNAFGDLLEGDSGGDGVRGATSAINDLAKLMASTEVKSAFGTITESVFKLLQLTTKGAVAFADFGKAIGEGLGRAVAGSDTVSGRISDEIETLEARLKDLAGELSRTRALRINPFASTEDLRQDYDAVLARLRNLRELQKGLGASVAPAGTPAPATPAGKPVPTGGGASAKSVKDDPLGDFMKNVEAAAKTAEAAMAKFRDVQLDAAVAGADLTRTERQFYDLINSPEWASMAEPYKALITAEFEAANSAAKAADEHQRLIDLIAATPTGQLAAQREQMQFLADAFLAGRINAEQFGEATTTALGNVADKAADTTDVMEEFTRQAARNMQDAFADFLFDPFADGLDGMLAGFGKMLQRMIAEAVAADLASRIMGPAGNGKGGWIDLAFTAASAYFGGGFGGTSTAPANISRGGGFSTSFDGGGFTGSGSRTGGVDGKGGFPAILHPNETVIDHTKGQRAGQSISITVNVPPGSPAETRRAAGAGAREALGAFSAMQRYA